MGRKTFTFIGIFAVLLMSLGMVSATDCLTLTEISVPTSVSDGGQAIVNFQLKCLTGINVTGLNWTLTANKAGSFTSSPTLANITNGSVENLSATFNLNSGQSGNLVLTIGVIGSSDDNATLVMKQIPIIPTPYNFCDEFSRENGTLKISDFAITNLGEGDDEEWELLDEIEIEVEIENTDNNDDVEDVIVEIMIKDNNGNDVTNDFDITDEKIDLGRIKEDDSEIAIFTIKEIPADLDDGKYKLYFRAYSEGDEDSHCIASSSDFDDNTYQEIEVTRLDSQAVIVKPEWTTVLASCGDKYVEVTLDVYNLGDDKEKKVLVNLFNSNLNINENVIINDLRSGKRQDATFTFDVPNGLTKKYYDLKVVTYYDYDEDEDELSEFAYDENSYNDLDKNFIVRLEILSCKGLAPTVKASLESVAEMETELVVKATILNNDENNDFIISVSDFDSWATLVSTAPQTVSIDKGKSAEVTIKFNPTIAGAHSFKINTIVDGETYSQLVSVNVKEKAKSQIFAGLDDTILYIIVGALVLLILISVILIVRVSRRRRVKPEF